MTTGIVYLMLALFSFSLMGVLHKLGDRVRANPVWVAALTMALACIMAATRSATGAGFTAVPRPVFWIALPFGLFAALALWTFQGAVRHGRIATSWLLLNLSVAIPTGLSIGLYSESISRTKAVALALILAAVILMWWDRTSEVPSNSRSDA